MIIIIIIELKKKACGHREETDYIFNFYLLLNCWKVYFRYLVPVFGKYDEGNKMGFYLEKVYFLT